MTRQATDLTLAYSPGSGLPYVVFEAGQVVAAFATPDARDDYVETVQRHCVCSVDRREANRL